MRLKTPLLLLAALVPAFGQQVDYNPGVQNAPGLLSDQARIPFTTFYAACTAANAAGKNLALTKTWTVTTSATCAAPVEQKGGKVVPASGHKVTMNVVSDPLNKPVCDITSGGTCDITTPNGEVFSYMWGAICDGANDRTTALNAALASVVITHQALRFLGACVASGTGLQLSANNQTVVVRGDDPRDTFILWKGTGSGITNAALTISSCYRCEFSGFGIVANTNLLDFGIVLKAQNGGLQSQGHFSNLWITDTSNSGKLKVGVYGYVPTPGDDFQNDLMTFSKVLISNIADEGADMLMEGFEDGEWSIDQNSTFQGGQCAITNGPLALASGTYGLGYSGSFQWSGGYVAAHKQADFCLGTVSGGVVRIAGNLRSEASSRFLVTTLTPGSATQVPVDIQDVDFSTGPTGGFAADGKVIVYRSGAALSISNSIFGVDGEAVPVKISLGGNPQNTGDRNVFNNVQLIGTNHTSVLTAFPDGLPTQFTKLTLSDSGGTLQNTYDYNKLGLPPRFYVRTGSYGTVTGIANALVATLPAGVFYKGLSGGTPTPGTQLTILIPPTLSLQAGANTLQLVADEFTGDVLNITRSATNAGANLTSGYVGESLVTVVYDQYSNSWRDIRQ